MKLFMRGFMDKERREIKPPLEYEAVCISCAGKLGGKMDKWLQTTWHLSKCSCCNNKTEVTSPRNYIWR